MKLSDIEVGGRAVIVKVAGHGGFRRRIVEMGFIKGKLVEVLNRAPLGDPIEYSVMGYNVSLRLSEAEKIEVITIAEAEEIAKQRYESGSAQTITEDEIRQVALDRRKEIQVALVGNPNAGKTSLFNVISGAHEKVGNYSGVTVDAKETTFEYKGYHIRLVDLPGTYSLSAYSPEERYVRNQIVKERPDVVVNVVDAGNLERNLFLTTQLIDMNVRMVIALNMYDELEAKGDRFDYEALGAMIGVPMIPTVSPKMRGINELFDTVIKIYEGGDYVDADGNLLANAEDDELLDRHYHDLALPHKHSSRNKQLRNLILPDAVNQRVRHIHIHYGATIEAAIKRVKNLLQELDIQIDDYTPRYVAIKLIEGDEEIVEITDNRLQITDNREQITDARLERLNRVLEEIRGRIYDEFKDTAENVINDAKYGFIAGALKETYEPQKKEVSKTLTDKIDNVVTSRWFGYPIFLLALFITFNATFFVGAYPMEWIDAGVGLLATWVRGVMPEGMLCDLLVDGIISGVGGVLVFLPNILILYFFISLMESSGYMARAAFIMDKLMHHIGLHGRSFIPLFMGFGCNVPAIMATRTIENRNARMITILIIPLMSCSARLPIFLLLAGTFFPQSAGVALFSMYMIGVVLAALMAILFRKVMFNKEETPFVMELPPYRMPSVKTMLRDTWEKGVQYLRKIGTTILVGSIVIWGLSYFPLENAQTHTDGIISHGEYYLSKDDILHTDNLSHTEGSDNTENAVALPADNSIINNFEQSEKLSSVSSVHSVRENNSVREKNNSVGSTSQLENSYLGQIGKAIQPALAPLGFDWKASVALVTGVTAKEIVVSTLGVLYSADEEDATSLSDKLLSATDENGEPLYNVAVAISLMLFVLIYLPCIGTLATIKSETGSWWWALFVAVYTIVLAWIVSFVAYQSIIHNVWQEVIVGFILILVVIYIISNVIRKFKKKDSDSPCSGCSAAVCDGCPYSNA
ncbi:MAG: ferrous iron transport protein B [Paludibacteraceae bacterium]|nr:ferrous iron transport protein B [Paludibacteraceae bacterium]